MTKTLGKVTVVVPAFSRSPVMCIYPIMSMEELFDSILRSSGKADVYKVVTSRV